MTEFDEKYWRRRWVSLTGGHSLLVETALDFAREVHTHAVEAMEEVKERPLSPIEQAYKYQARQAAETGCRPVDLRCHAQPRTLFEDAALAALQGLTRIAPLDRDWPLPIETAHLAVNYARAFVDAVREAGK